MDKYSNDFCPRCHEGPLRTWHELNEEERMLARRLPGNANYSAGEREKMHRWCVRCWYEEAQSHELDV